MGNNSFIAGKEEKVHENQGLFRKWLNIPNICVGFFALRNKEAERMAFFLDRLSHLYSAMF